MSCVVILGAGIAGLSAGYHLQQAGIEPVLYEKNPRWGGLCDNFEVGPFRFDRFVHLSFSEDDYVKKLFTSSCAQNYHIPDPVNYYKGVWLKHPAQNNIYKLDVAEKIKIINDFYNRKPVPEEGISNMEEWLRLQYGDYFAKNFAMKYTRKYWTCEACELETSWTGSRFYLPSVEEVLEGAMTEDTPHTYYAKEMRYPQKGGYRSFLTEMAGTLDIRTDKEVTAIDPFAKSVFFADGTSDSYEYLISTLPLPEYVKLISGLPAPVELALKNLKYTSGVLVSLGFRRPDVAKHLWFYIYDEEILPARVNSPSRKSEDNAPEGCSSLQAEIYLTPDQLEKADLTSHLESTIRSLLDMGVFEAEDLMVKDARKEQYANVIFDHDIYKNRKIVHDYLDQVGIDYAGRFGEWEYFWSDQSLLSGKRKAEELVKKIKKSCVNGVCG